MENNKILTGMEPVAPNYGYGQAESNTCATNKPSRTAGRPSYIDYMNNFNRWLESNYLPGHSQLIYFKLLNVFNRAGWPESIQMDNLRLMVLSDLRTETTFIRARNKLVESGLAEFHRGTKGAPSRYSLLNIYSKNWSESASRNDSTTARESESENASQSARHIKNKTPMEKKTNTKTSIPPIAPRGENPPVLAPCGRNASTRDWDDLSTEGFNIFWKAYPRQIRKQAAEEAFYRAIEKVSLETLMSALERHKQSQKWAEQNGRFIPAPDRWLNEERWNMELQPLKASNSGLGATIPVPVSAARSLNE